MEDKFNPFLVFGPKKKSLDDRKKNLMKKIKHTQIEKEFFKTIDKVKQGDVWNCQGFLGYKNK